MHAIYQFESENPTPYVGRIRLAWVSLNQMLMANDFNFAERAKDALYLKRGIGGWHFRVGPTEVELTFVKPNTDRGKVSNSNS